MRKSVVDKIVVTMVSLIVPLVIVIMLINHLDKAGYDYSLFKGVDTANTLLGVWSTLLGFMITAVSILMTIGGNQFIEAFRKSKHYHTVMYTHVLTCLILFAATVFSVAIICLDIWSKFCFLCLIFFLFSTFVALGFSIFFLFFLIFKSQ